MREIDLNVLKSRLVDKKMAGKTPAKKPKNDAIKIKYRIVDTEVEYPICKDLLKKLLNSGRINSTNIKAIKRAIKLKIMDSPSNWNISWGLFAPATFLTIISLARLVKFAVDKFT